MIITESQLSSYLNPITLTKDFVYLCMESYVNTYDSKYLNILIDDYTLQEAYDTEWAKADALGDQTRDTNDATADTNKEIKMLRAMLRAAINKPKEYIQDKIKWLKKWMEDHFSKKHMEKMKDSAKDLWEKVRNKALYVIQRLKDKLSGKDKDVDQFDFTESNYLLSIDEMIDNVSVIQETSLLQVGFKSGPSTDDKTNVHHGLYSYSGFGSYSANAYHDKEKTKRVTNDNSNVGLGYRLKKILYNAPDDNHDFDIKQVSADMDLKKRMKDPITIGYTEKEKQELTDKLKKLDTEGEKVNHPKSWFAKKIAWLRGLYTNILHKMDKISMTDSKGVLGKIKKTLASLASYVMHLIDRFMNKLQLMTDKD